MRRRRLVCAFGDFPDGVKEEAHTWRDNGGTGVIVPRGSRITGNVVAQSNGVGIEADKAPR